MSLFKDLFVAGDIQADEVTASKGIDGNQGGGYAERAKSITKPAVIADYFQKKLVSRVNIATINGQSLLGSGNIDIGVGRGVIQDPDNNPIGSIVLNTTGTSNLRIYTKYNNNTVDFNDQFKKLKDKHIIRIGITRLLPNDAPSKPIYISYFPESFTGNGNFTSSYVIYPVEISGNEDYDIKAITYYYLK